MGLPFKSIKKGNILHIRATRVRIETKSRLKFRVDVPKNVKTIYVGERNRDYSPIKN